MNTKACPAPAVEDPPLDHTSGSRQLFPSDRYQINLPKEEKAERKSLNPFAQLWFNATVYMDLMRDQNLGEFLTSLQRSLGNTRKGLFQQLFNDCRSFKMA